MLEYLSIKNFALIEDLQIHFSSNFNVLTGETGTGMSIIIDALSLLLGGRAQAEYIRTGTEKALVEGVFSLPAGDPFWKQIDEWDLRNEDRTLILSREISLNGRNICRINGRILTLAQYRQIGLALWIFMGSMPIKAFCRRINTGSCWIPLVVGTSAVSFKSKGALSGVCGFTEGMGSFKAFRKERLQKIDFLQYQLNEIKGPYPKRRNGRAGREVNILANAEKSALVLQKPTKLCLVGTGATQPMIWSAKR